jgi:hypothetical protein
MSTIWFAMKLYLGYVLGCLVLSFVGILAVLGCLLWLSRPPLPPTPGVRVIKPPIWDWEYWWVKWKCRKNK